MLALSDLPQGRSLCLLLTRGRFERISWDEALDTIADRLKAIAAREPQAILPYSYAGTMGLVQGDSMSARFFHKLGASRLERTICASAGAAAG